MRKLIVFGLALGFLAFGGQPSHAYSEGPWCLKTNKGKGHVTERCSFASFNACERMRILEGELAFCIQSHRYLPNWHGRGWEQPVRVAKPKRPRRH